MPSPEGSKLSIASLASSSDSPDTAAPSTEAQTTEVVQRPSSVTKTDWSPDVEAIAGSSTGPRDPFQLSLGRLSDAQISELRRRKKGKKVAKYHSRQNELIESLLKPMDEHTEERRNSEEALRLPIKVAVRGSLLANFCLAGLQLYAAITSLSLSLIATGIDSLFDVGSNVLMYYIYYKAQNLDSNKWPVGGNRLECIGNIVYGSLMGAVNLVVIVESARDLISGGSDKPFRVPALIAVGVALGVKFVLFLYCFSLRNKSDQVRVLWEDHRNDLFINGFGLLMSALGSRVVWYLDPLGAILVGHALFTEGIISDRSQIALVVIYSWCRTIYGQFELLAGKSATHEFLQLIVYNAMTFSDDIEKVDTVRAYHSGPEYYVEVDIVMDANTPLWKAHDLSQQLQDKIEVLPNVERAFVHVDYETTHTPEHRKKKPQ